MLSIVVSGSGGSCVGIDWRCGRGVIVIIVIVVGMVLVVAPG